MKHHANLEECLNDEDRAFSEFQDNGDGYCHLCTTWHTNAVEKARHRRKSTVETKNEPTPIDRRL